MNFKNFLLLLLCLTSSVILYAEGDKSHYSGGMLIYQPGITITENEYQPIQSYSTSIGGILRIYFWDICTAGLYGGHQKSQYNTTGSDNSYFNLGYGGGFIGFSKKIGKFRYTASAFTGMGSIQNLHIEMQDGTMLSEAQLYKQAVFLYSPILSVDYAITKRLYVTMQTVCLTGKYQDKPFYNPTLQLGILFSR